MSNYLKNEIKQNLLEKVIEENKINFFIRKFFDTNEVWILSIYEGLLNNIFQLNKNNEDVITEILTVLKQTDWFFLDNLFSVFRPADETLQTQLFNKLNLKSNELSNNWIITLSEPVFSDKEIVKFFENIWELVNSYESFVELFFEKEIKIPEEIREQALHKAENDILEIYVKDWIEITKEKKRNILAKNELKVSKRQFDILKTQYKTELITKLRELFNVSLQKDIEEELDLINIYIKHKINKDFIEFVLNNNLKTKKERIKKLNEILLKTKDDKEKALKIKKIIDWLNKSIENIWKKTVLLDTIEKKKNTYSSMVKETIDKKIQKLLKNWLFGGSQFSKDMKIEINNQIENVFTKEINYKNFYNIQNITWHFIDKEIFGNKTKIDYLKFVKQDEKIKKKIDWLNLINKFSESFLSEHLSDIEMFVWKFNENLLINYHLYKTEKLKSAISENFYIQLFDILVQLRIETFFLENVPIELQEILNTKIEKELKNKWLEGHELKIEKEKERSATYKMFVFLVIDSIFNVIQKNILEKNFKELEINYLINKEKNKFIPFKYDEIIENGSKEIYYKKYYEKFILQKDFVSKFTQSFLIDYHDFELFYKNYLYLVWNKDYFKPIIEEFDWINHKDYMYEPKFDKSYLSILINKKLDLWNKLIDLSNDYWLKIEFLNEKFVKKFNDIFLELNDISKIDIIYFINFILTTPWISVKIEESFIRVNVWTKVFIFFSNPSFEVLNNIAIFFENNDKEKEKIFILMKNNFYYFLNQAFMSNLNLAWIQQEFKNVLEYSYHNSDVSDVSIFWSKTLNAWYMIIREWKLYNLVKFKSGSESSYLLLFKTIEKIIENIINLGWAIAETKVVDTTVTIGWVEYRTSILRDWDRIWITFRKNWHKSKLKLSNYELRKKYNLEFENIQLVDASEAIPLEAWYEAWDIAIMKRYALQDEWIFWIVWKTGSWKSVSIRNILNYIFDQRLKDDVYVKIITLEDPIESKNLNFTQYNAKGKELIEFIKGIKRSDPDILLIWETRNYEMLLDVLEFSSMMGIFTTLHASSLISTLFLLWQYAIRAQVWLTDVLSQTKVIISQKLLKHKKPKISIEEWIKRWHIKYFDQKGKQELLDWVFEWYFSSYISEAETKKGTWSGLQKNKILFDLKEIKKELIRERKYVENKTMTEDMVEGPIEDLNTMITEINSVEDVVSGYIEIKWIENWTTKLTKNEAKRRYELWKEFKKIFLQTEIMETLHKEAQQPKLYYEYATKELFKDNLTQLMKLSDKDSPLGEIENMFAMKTVLKEERAFIDMMKGILPFSEFLTLSAYLTPAIFDKLKSNKKL